MSRRSVAALVGVALVVVAALALLRRPETSMRTPSEAEVFLAKMGVTTESGPPSEAPLDSVVLLPQDFRTADQDEHLLDWVRDGGRLVVADPGSQMLDIVGATDEGPSTPGEIPPGCAAPEVLGVDAIVVSGSDRLLASTAPKPLPCFPSPSGSYMLRMSEGNGTLVILGGTSFLEKPNLHVQNATFLMGLLDDRTRLVFGTPSDPGSTGPGLWSTLPGPAKALAIQMCVVALFYSLVRARRLGMRVDETPLSPIPAGELVRATGHLYRRAGAAQHAAATSRRWWSRRVARRLNFPMGEPLDADLIAEMTQLDAGSIRAVLESTPTSDASLLDLEHQMETTYRKIGEGVNR